MNREAALNRVEELQRSLVVSQDGDDFFSRSPLDDRIGGWGADENDAIDDALPQCWKAAGFVWVDGEWEFEG